jgi:hypothetical protein
MKIFILTSRNQKCDVLRAPILKSLSYREHIVKQLVDTDGCYAGIDIRHGVRNDQFVVMNYRTAGINNIGNIPLALFLVRRKQRFISASYDFCRLFKIKQYGADAILTHRSDAVGEHNPAFIGFQG